MYCQGLTRLPALTIVRTHTSYICWSFGNMGPWPRSHICSVMSTRAWAWAWARRHSALIRFLPSCLLRVGNPGRSNSVPTFLSSTSPSWTPATLTQPPALGSCSGVRRTLRRSLASTALMTASSSRWVPRLAPAPHASLCPLLQLCICSSRSLCTHQALGTLLLVLCLHITYNPAPLSHLAQIITSRNEGLG